MFGNVFFSVLHPGTRYEPHCGPTNIRHRMHFTLSVPPTRSSSSLSTEDDEGGEPMLKLHDGISNTSVVEVHWKVGEAFVYDDSLVHSVDYCGDTNGRDSCGDEDGNGDDNRDGKVAVTTILHLGIISSLRRRILFRT